MGANAGDLMTKESFFEFSGLPGEIGVILFVLGLIFSLAGAFGGKDFGIFRVPDFGATAHKYLIYIGPLIMVVVALGFAPLISRKGDGVLTVVANFWQDEPAEDGAWLPYDVKQGSLVRLWIGAEIHSRQHVVVEAVRLGGTEFQEFVRGYEDQENVRRLEIASGTTEWIAVVIEVQEFKVWRERLASGVALQLLGQSGTVIGEAQLPPLVLPM